MREEGLVVFPVRLVTGSATVLEEGEGEEGLLGSPVSLAEVVVTTTVLALAANGACGNHHSQLWREVKQWVSIHYKVKCGYCLPTCYSRGSSGTWFCQRVGR